MTEPEKYLTEEEMLSGKQGLVLCPYIIIHKVLEENSGVDMSEVNNIDTPTQAPG